MSAARHVGANDLESCIAKWIVTGLTRHGANGVAARKRLRHQQSPSRPRSSKDNESHRLYFRRSTRTPEHESLTDGEDEASVFQCGWLREYCAGFAGI